MQLHSASCSFIVINNATVVYSVQLVNPTAPPGICILDQSFNNTAYRLV